MSSASPAGSARLRTPREGQPARAWDPSAPIPAPLALHRAQVPAAWVDYNGHLSESCYLQLIGDHSDAFFRYVGIDEAYRQAGASLFTAETHLHHLREVREGQWLALTVQLLAVDAKRLHLFQVAVREETGEPVCTAEQLLVHVDTRAGRSAPMGTQLLARLGQIAASHAALPRPPEVGHVMGIGRPPPAR